MINMIEIKCNNCNKVFNDYKSNNKKFCNNECYHRSLKNKKPWNKGLTKEIDSRIKSYPCSIEKKKKISLSNKGKLQGRIPGNKGMKMSKEIREKNSRAKIKQWQNPEYRNKLSGKNSSNWKGGISDLNEQERNGAKYQRWRKEVLSKDNYTCQKCNQRGNLKDNVLNCHHIENFSDKEELRYEVSNGITFCDECHKIFHEKYKSKNNTLDQVLEFIN